MTIHDLAVKYSDAAHLIDDLRRLDPALRTLIDARLACEICSNRRHEHHGKPHGDKCQAWPFARADLYADAVEYGEQAKRALATAENLIEKLRAAAEDIDDVRVPFTHAVFEDTILEPLRAAMEERAGIRTRGAMT
jgi:hypothetical protein